MLLSREYTEVLLFILSIDHGNTNSCWQKNPRRTVTMIFFFLIVFLRAFAVFRKFSPSSCFRETYISMNYLYIKIKGMYGKLKFLTVSLFITLDRFHKFFCFSIVDFGQFNVGWTRNFLKATFSQINHIKLHFVGISEPFFQACLNLAMFLS